MKIKYQIVVIANAEKSLYVDFHTLTLARRWTVMKTARYRTTANPDSHRTSVTLNSVTAMAD